MSVSMLTVSTCIIDKIIISSMKDDVSHLSFFSLHNAQLMQVSQ